MTQYAPRLILGFWVIPLIAVMSARAQHQVSIIPKPQTLEIHEGEFVFPANTPCYAFEPFLEVAALLDDHPFAAFAPVERIKSHRRIPEAGVRLVEARDIDKLAPDAYRLLIDTSGITITAHQPAAMRYGILTLMQLAYTLPNGGVLPAMLIEDKPRFGYRGLHLDVSGHFYPVSFLKKFIDIMALYKFNSFHWHLAGGPGWRLEIKRYPELTQKAAWRTHTRWKDWWQKGRRYLPAGHPNASGGYYTQDEARDLVAYAKRKGITIVPEIDVLGHADEVLAVYPQLSCTGRPYQHGEFCIGNEETFTFLRHVLEEVVDIFPSTYIHIGGDEANGNAWEACPKCQALMEKKGLKDVNELQRDVVKRLNTFLQSYDRKLIGPDEILGKGLPADATIMGWRGTVGGIRAANAGHDVIMTPDSHLYFDHYQGNPSTQPEAAGGYTPVQKVYGYEPVSDDIAADKRKHVLGAQGNIRTEYMPTADHVEYMVFPRALALAEVVWSASADRDWNDFQRRLQHHYPLLQRLHVNYYRPSYEVDIAVDFNADTLTNTISMATEQRELGIRYTTDGKEPDAESPVYTKPIELAVPAVVKAAYFVDSGRVGPVAAAKADIHKAIGKSITYQTSWDDAYPAQAESTLLNGQKGGKHADDGQWQGFTNHIDVTVDFERRESMNNVAISFLQDPAINAYQPGEVKVLLSDNGKNFREAGTLVNGASPQEKFRQVRTFELKFDTAQTARYLRIVATNVRNALLLADEVVVY